MTMHELRGRAQREIVECVVKTFLVGEFSITVDNGDDFDYELTNCTDYDTVMAHLFQCDEERLLVSKKQGQHEVSGEVFFVYGNDGWDVINDYHTILSPWLKPAEVLADQWSKKLDEACASDS